MSEKILSIAGAKHVITEPLYCGTPPPPPSDSLTSALIFLAVYLYEYRSTAAGDVSISMLDPKGQQSQEASLTHGTGLSCSCVRLSKSRLTSRCYFRLSLCRCRHPCSRGRRHAGRVFVQPPCRHAGASSFCNRQDPMLPTLRLQHTQNILVYTTH